MPLQEGAPLQEPVPGQLVEGVVRAVAAYPGEQAVDECEGVGGVGSPGRIHPSAAAEPPAPALAEPSVAPVASVGRAGVRPCVGITRSRLAWTTPRSAPSRAHCRVVSWPPCRCRPSIQGAARTRGPDDGDGAPVGAGQRRGDGDAEVRETLGRPVLAGDRGRVGGLGVEMVLEEVAAAGGAQPVAAVEQPLFDGVAGQRGPGGVLAEEGAQRGA